MADQSPPRDVAFSDLAARVTERARSFSWSHVDHGEQLDVSFDRFAPISMALTDPTVATFVRKHHENNWTIEPMPCLLLDCVVDLFGLRHFCDIGTHYGFLSLYMARMDAIARVDSIEMNPQTVAVYRDNLALNPQTARDKVRIHNVGISNFEALQQRIWYRGMRLFFEEVTGHAMPSADIDILTLTGLMDRIDGTPDLLKIDVEGYEAQMVDGLAALADGAHPCILLELHGDDLIERYGSTRTEIMHTLLDRGYRCALLNWHQKMPRANHLTEVTAETLEAILRKPHGMYFFW